MKTFSEVSNLNGRTAIITGGAGHIGFTAAQTLAELGANIVLIDLEKAALEERCDQLQNDFESSPTFLDCDLTDDTQRHTIAEKVLRNHREINVLINCAAMVGTKQNKGWNTPFETQDSETWRRSMEININAPMFLTQSLARHMKKAVNSSVVNISSIYGLVGPDLRIYGDTEIGSPAAYAAAKGGLIQMSRWLATVLAPEIRVNTITCGGVFRGQPEEFVKNYSSKTPLQRMATEEDFKGAIAYLSSDLSSYVTGQNIVVDGGWTSW